MLGRQILKSHFGKHYKIHLIKDGPVPRSLKPERFSSSHSVRQFLQGLQAPQSYWRGLAVYCDDAAPYRSHQRDYLCVVGNNVLSGRIRIYEVDLPDTHALVQSSAAIQDRQGYQYQFISMRQALASSSRSPQRFTSTQQVYETLYELAPNLEQLQALAADLQLTSSPQQQTYTQLMDVLAEGLAEQRVALYVTAPFKRPEPTGAALEAASNMPGNRKVELAPATPAARTGSKVVENKKTPDNLTAAQRIEKLDLEGHAPVRHGGPNRVTDLQLEDRAVRGIDPASGTTFDAFNQFPDGSPKPHKVGRNATAFISDDALLQADDFARSSTQFQQNVAAARANGDIFVDAVELPLRDVFGSNYQNYVRGVTRLGSKNNPAGHISTDFTDGTLKAIYRLDQSGNVKLHTLYPNPKP